MHRQSIITDGLIACMELALVKLVQQQQREVTNFVCVSRRKKSCADG